MEKVKRCRICGKQLELFKKENYTASGLSSYAFASRKAPEYMHWALYECKDCRILYSQCPMGADEITNNYKTASYDSSKEADYASDTYFKYLKKKLPAYPKGSALDIGTGNGAYLLRLKKNGVGRICGVEPSKAPIEDACKKVKHCIIHNVFQKGMFEPNSFDMVSLFQTAEHVPNPLGTMKEVYKILNNNGYFYLICHNYRSLVNRILGGGSPIYDIEHLQVFSKKSIYRAVRKAGFREIQVFTIRNRYPLQYWLRLLPMPAVMKTKILAVAGKSGIGKVCVPINVGNIGIIAKK